MSNPRNEFGGSSDIEREWKSDGPKLLVVALRRYGLTAVERTNLKVQRKCVGRVGFSKYSAVTSGGTIRSILPWEFFWNIKNDKKKLRENTNQIKLTV